MKDGARILVRTCANVQTAENVVIVTDAERMVLARAVADEALEAGAALSIVIPPERSIDNEEPGPAVAAALSAADVVFLPVTLAMAHTRAVREAIGAGARVLSMTAFTERMMHEGGLFTDFSARQPLCLALAARLTAGEHLRVTNPAGTDLTMSLVGVTGNSHACLLDGPGFSAVPNIEANCAPAQGTGEGVFVCDGSIPYYGVGPVRDPVTFRISEGFVTHIEGGDQADFLSGVTGPTGGSVGLQPGPVRIRPESGLHRVHGGDAQRRRRERHGPYRDRNVRQPGRIRVREDPLRRRHTGPDGVDRRGTGALRRRDPHRPTLTPFDR